MPFALALAALLAARPAPSAPAAAPLRAVHAPAVPTDDVELAGPGLGAVREPSAPDAWGGPRTGREPTLSDRVASYALRAVLDPVKHTIEGTERLTWRNRSAVPIRTVYLHLYLNAFESDASTFGREALLFDSFRDRIDLHDHEWGYTTIRTLRQGGRDATLTFVHPDGGPETDHTVLRVDLPDPVPPGGTTVLDVSFFDQLPRVKARSGWVRSFHLVAQWFPKIGVLELPGERGATRPRWNCHEYHMHSEFYADFGSYDLEVVAPEGFTVASVGAPVGGPEHVPGGLSHRFHAADVHDVAFAAWDGFAKPLEATWTGPGSPPVRVTVLYPPEFERSARESLQADLDALTFFSRTLGPYPYTTSTVVIPPHGAEEAGGMEYETFFTGDATNVGPFSSEGISRFVTVHEFGHGYFMGLLASNEFEEPFLDEGLNEWWDARMLGTERHPLEVVPPLLRWLGVQRPILDQWDQERVGGARRSYSDAIAGNSWNRWSTGGYELVYARTAVAFRALGEALGEETTARAMRLYYQRWHFRHPGTADLRQAFLDAAPTPADRATVERFFEEQVYRVAPVDDRVVEVSSEELVPGPGYARDGGGAPVDVFEAEANRRTEAAREAFREAHGPPAPDKPGPFPFRSTVRVRRFGPGGLPRQVEVTFEDGAVERFDWPADQRWARLVLDRPTRARQARLLPADAPLDAGWLDDARTREPRRGPAARLALTLEGWLRAALSLLEVL